MFRHYSYRLGIQRQNRLYLHRRNHFKKTRF